MKKFILLSLSAGMFINVHAQTPKKVSTSLVHKITATWCGPCGDWGWTTANDLIDATTGKALFVSIYADPSSDFDNNKFYTATSRTLAKAFTFSGYPSFGSNGIARMPDPIYTSVIISNVTKAVDDFAATTPVASPANVMKITGSTIDVDATVKFWSASSGDYYLAAYIIEDNAKNKQNNQTGIVSHHDVMRGSMSTNVWGAPIATGSIAANATYNQKFTFTITNPSWIKDSLKVYTVIWKKDTAGKYEFINASETEPTPTSLTTISGINSLKLAPNPSFGQNATLQIQSTGQKNITIGITDYTGRSVYSREDISLSSGLNILDIPSGNFAPGVYMVRISSESGQMTEKLSVVK